MLYSAIALIVRPIAFSKLGFSSSLFSPFLSFMIRHAYLLFSDSVAKFSLCPSTFTSQPVQLCILISNFLKVKINRYASSLLHQNNSREAVYVFTSRCRVRNLIFYFIAQSCEKPQSLRQPNLACCFLPEAALSAPRGVLTQRDGELLRSSENIFTDHEWCFFKVTQQKALFYVAWCLTVCLAWWF